MKKKLSDTKSEKNQARAARDTAAARKKLGKTVVAALRTEVVADTDSRRRTSRSGPGRTHSYLRPMSAVDLAKKKNLPVSDVRKALGPRADVVRRYRKAATQRKMRNAAKVAQENGHW
jgi:hypothetical protein